MASRAAVTCHHWPKQQGVQKEFQMAPRAVLYRPLVNALGDKPNGLGGFTTGGKFQQGFALLHRLAHVLIKGHWP